MQRMTARKKEPIEYWPEALGILVIVIYFINYIVGIKGLHCPSRGCEPNTTSPEALQPL